MAQIAFTQNLQRHVSCPPRSADGTSVREVLDMVFADNERARGYVLDEHGALRKHMVIFINGIPIRDRDGQSDDVGPSDEIFVMQALSGG